MLRPVSSTRPEPQLYAVNIDGIDPRLMIASDDHLRIMVERFQGLLRRQDEGGDGALLPDRVLGMMQRLETTYTYVIARLGAREAAEEAVVYGRPTAMVTLELPAESAVAGDRFLTLLDEADEYCRSRPDLIDVVCPPDVAAFRTWFISEITRQLRMVDAG